MKIYFIVSSKEDTPSNELLDKLKSLGKVIVIRHKGKLAELKQLQKDQEPKVIGVDPGVFDWDLDIDAFKQIPSVKAVCTSSTSFDWLKPKELKKMGIIACNAPGFSTDSVAEYALCMAITVARRTSSVFGKEWGKYDFESAPPMLLKGKTAAIIGLGRIGTRMAEVCAGIGMKVIYWSRRSRDKRFKYVNLDKLFKTADVVMPALIENEKTKKIVTKKRLDSMKPTAILVGINRVKSIWDESCVLKKVQKKEIAGYAFEGENTNHPSTYKGNVWSLPAMIWFTKNSLENLMKVWVETVKATAQGKPQNKVN